RCDAIGMRQLLLHLTQRRLRPLALGQIEHEREALLSTFVEDRRTDQQWHAAAVLAEILLLERPRHSGHPQLLNGKGGPFRRSEVRPPQSAREEVLAVVSYCAKIGVVGVENLALRIPDANPDNVGVKQAPYLRLALRQITVEMGVLERDRRLGSEELQHRDPGRRENAGRQV